MFGGYEPTAATPLAPIRAKASAARADPRSDGGPLVDGYDPLNLVDHWVPRSDWSPGRALASCYLTVPDHQPVIGSVLAYQRAVAPMPEMDLVPIPWLHATVQAVDFLDLLARRDVEGFVRALGEDLAGLPPLELRTGPPALGGSGAFLLLEPAEEVVAIREVVRDVARRILGATVLHALPGQGPGGFPPHLTFAYSNTTVARASVMQRLSAVPFESVPVTVPAVSFLHLHREHRTWRWSDERRLPLGGRSAALV